MEVEISQHQLMVSFVIFTHHFSCLPTLHLASQPYMPRMQLPFPPDVHYKSGKLRVSVYSPKLPQCVHTD